MKQILPFGIYCKKKLTSWLWPLADSTRGDEPTHMQHVYGQCVSSDSCIVEEISPPLVRGQGDVDDEGSMHAQNSAHGLKKEGQIDGEDMLSGQQKNVCRKCFDQLRKQCPSCRSCNCCPDRGSCGPIKNWKFLSLFDGKEVKAEDAIKKIISSESEEDFQDLLNALSIPQLKFVQRILTIRYPTNDKIVRFTTYIDVFYDKRVQEAKEHQENLTQKAELLQSCGLKILIILLVLVSTFTIASEIVKKDENLKVNDKNVTQSQDNDLAVKNTTSERQRNLQSFVISAPALNDATTPNSSLRFLTQQSPSEQSQISLLSSLLRALYGSTTFYFVAIVMFVYLTVLLIMIAIKLIRIYYAT